MEIIKIVRSETARLVEAFGPAFRSKSSFAALQKLGCCGLSIKNTPIGTSLVASVACLNFTNNHTKSIVI